jgi:hypothetical protein
LQNYAHKTQLSKIKKIKLTNKLWNENSNKCSWDDELEIEMCTKEDNIHLNDQQRMCKERSLLNEGDKCKWAIELWNEEKTCDWKKRGTLTFATCHYHTLNTPWTMID